MRRRVRRSQTNRLRSETGLRGILGEAQFSAAISASRYVPCKQLTHERSSHGHGCITFGLQLAWPRWLIARGRVIPRSSGPLRVAFHACQSPCESAFSVGFAAPIRRNPQRGLRYASVQSLLTVLARRVAPGEFVEESQEAVRSRGSPAPYFLGWHAEPGERKWAHSKDDWIHSTRQSCDALSDS